MFINVAGAQERVDTVQDILSRFQGMSQEEADRIYQSLKAYESINNAANPSNTLSNVDPEIAENTLRQALESRSEIVRSNLISSLGFTPTETEMTELTRFTNTLGSSFSSIMPRLGNVYDQAEGGISSVLFAIDNGITTGIQNIVAEGEKISNQLVSAAQEAAGEVFGNGEGLSDITDTISNILQSTTSSINSAISSIDAELNSISQDIQQKSAEFIDNNISSPIQNSINKIIGSSITQPRTLPEPTTPTGEPYPAAGGISQPGDNPSPLPGSALYNENLELYSSLLRLRASSLQLEERARVLSQEQQ